MASTQVAAAPGASPAPTHAYTCNTCQVAYRNSDLQKGHMKSDWHRYNLKRKIASLPPISAEIFTEKVLQARAATAAEADKALFERTCDVCERTYNSENAYNNHMSSQKHKQRLLQGDGKASHADDAASSIISSTFSLGDPMSADKASVDSDAEEEFQEVVENLKKTGLDDKPSTQSPLRRPPNPRPSAQPADDEDDDMSDRTEGASTPVPGKNEPAYTPTTCLFCNYSSPTVPLNAHHMERFHGMFVPEKKFLVDLEGLLAHLQKKVYEKHQCVSCGKFKGSAFALQTHMRDKSHCSIPYTSMKEQLDIGDFYDFRSTYSDGEDSEDDEMDDDAEQNGDGKLPFKPKYVKLALDARGDESDEDEEWETDDESVASDEITAIYDNDTKFDRLDKHTHHSKHDPRHHHQVDGWHSHAHKHNHAVFYDEHSLYLPSGKTVGHRSLAVYYRQNLHSYPTPAERAERSAIEAEVNRAAMSAGDRMALDGEEDPELDRQIATIQEMAGGLQLSRRDAMGLVGLSDQDRRAALKKAQRARARQQRSAEDKAWRKQKAGNKTKGYGWHVGLGIAD